MEQILGGIIVVAIIAFIAYKAKKASSDRRNQGPGAGTPGGPRNPVRDTDEPIQ